MNERAEATETTANRPSPSPDAPSGSSSAAVPEGAPEARGAAGARKSPYLLIGLAVLALDQWTKWLIEAHLPEQTSHEVIPGLLHISHVRNTGVAFGMLAAHGASGGMIWLVLLGAVALTVIGVFFWRTPASDRLLLVALALVLGGAVGNLLDRLASGAVTDFLLVYLGSYHWPDFNVADSAISLGLVLLVLDSFRSTPDRAAAGSGEAGT